MRIPCRRRLLIVAVACAMACLNAVSYAADPLDEALDEAQAKGWTIADMKSDWSRIFP